MSQSAAQKTESFVGTVEKVVFANEDTGFGVLRVEVQGDPFLRTVVGSLLSLQIGEQASFTGHWVQDARFGKQFSVTQCSPSLPTTKEAIERYLGGGLVPGVGKEMAHRLVRLFGQNTLEIIQNDPERLCEVEGIGPKRRAQIVRAWNDQKGVRDVMLFLNEVGVSPAYATRIYKTYGASAPSVMRADPYRLARDVQGIGFKIADKIAGEIGIALDDPRRLEAGISFTLWESQNDGHVYLPEEELGARAAELLLVDVSQVKDALEKLIEGGWVKAESLPSEIRAVYHPILRDHEMMTARRLIKLIQQGKGLQKKGSRQRLSFPAHAIAATQMLSDEQKAAIRLTLENPVTVITGGPGTGKTTLINALLGLLESKGVKTALCAPTGRAAKRLGEASSRTAQTIHRLLEFHPGESRFQRNAQNPLEAGAVIVDEASMIDLPLARALLEAIKPGARLCMVGDVDQLPSVGPGLVLSDMIRSEVIPVARLREVFRQAAKSHIVKAAYTILQGMPPEGAKDPKADFFIIPRKEPVAVLQTLSNLITHRIPKAFHLDPRKDIQVLAPMHRGVVGVENLNVEIQTLLNPGGASLGPRSRGLRVGDKVMQIRNDYDKDVYNGDVGWIEGYQEEDGLINVRFDDRSVIYPVTDLDELTLAYALSIHKSQGSEYPAVLIPLVSQHYMMLQRNLLYTAITRGRQLVIIVGFPRAIKHAVQNEQPLERYTRLRERLQQEKGLGF